MVYAQTNPLSLTKSRLLEGEKELAYECMPAITFVFVFKPLNELECSVDS